MGKAMAKSDVVYGEQRAISVKSFNDAEVKNMVDAIRSKIGPKPVISLIQMRDALRKAQADPAFKDGRVKVGVIDGDLIWRAKEKNFTGAKELDAIVVKRYSAQLSAYREELQAIANEKAKDRLEAERLKKLQEAKKAPAKKPVLAKAPSRLSLSSSSEEDFDSPEFREMQQRVMEAKKANSMATAMRELNDRGKTKKKEEWTKYSLKVVSREDAEAALKAAGDGSWLVRTGSNNKPVVSYIKGSKISHDVLDKAIANGGGPKDKSLDTGKAIRSTTVLKRLVATGKFNVTLTMVQAMPGYFNNLNAKSAEEKLAGAAAGSWLVRGSGTNTGGISWSWKEDMGGGTTAVRHDRLLNMKKYQTFVAYTQGAGRGHQVVK